MVIVSLTIYENKKAKDGEPRDWISLREIWSKVGYKIPYSRWVLYTLKNFGIQPRIIKKKREGPGQPMKMYYIPLDYSKELLGAISRRRHVEIKTMRKK